jgi:hypothetical protein
VKPALRQRLANQRLAAPADDAVELVRSMLAMQAQEYWGGVWAVCLRTRGATAASIEAALVRGDLLRSHPMRGTHHFVARDDLRWLMELMGPLMIQRHARRFRELELDEKTLSKAMRVLHKALEGGRQLTRAEAGEVLTRARIAVDGFQRLPHIIYRAELELLVCSGARKGKQVTIALFDDRVPASKPRPREEALADLARRYFATRAPATLADFAWWCQLPMADVRAAVELAGVDVNGPGPKANGSAPRALALPPYDEYTVAYTDRSAVGAAPKHVTGWATSLLGPLLLLDGEVAGEWWREGKGVKLEPWRKLSKADTAALEKAAQRYVAFAG